MEQQRYHFLFPDGQRLAFDGEFVGGLRAFLGRSDLAVYRTAEGAFIIVLASDLRPQFHFRYDTAEDMALFLLGAMAQLRKELLGEDAERLGERDLEEFLRGL